jgi:hypothetical protein
LSEGPARVTSLSRDTAHPTVCDGVCEWGVVERELEDASGVDVSVAGGKVLIEWITSLAPSGMSDRPAT